MNRNPTIRPKMKKKTLNCALAGILAATLFVLSCTKDPSGSSSLYVPTSADVTANATLQELTDGRALYINNCGQCHSLYLPDNYTPSQWSVILDQMAPNTSMNASEVGLVRKYLTRGKQ